MKDEDYPVLDVHEAHDLHQRGAAVFIDVREAHERPLGVIEGDAHIPLNKLPFRMQSDVIPEGVVVFYCAVGQRSLDALAMFLDEFPDREAYSITGGFRAWRACEKPWVKGCDSEDRKLTRYSRHLSLADIGVAGQEKLLGSRVLIIGGGGLGSPVALYLAAAGVGSISIVDDDRVELSNLQRQVMHSESRVGMLKSESALVAMQQVNSDIELKAINKRLDEALARELFPEFDLLVDCTDNFPTRLLINRLCLELGKTFVFGAAQGLGGQLSIFSPGQADSPCYRCLFPDPPADAPKCSETGVLGVVPGVIGQLQAVEAIKCLLGLGESLQGYLLQYDAFAASFRKIRLRKDISCPECGASNV